MVGLRLAMVMALTGTAAIAGKPGSVWANVPSRLIGTANPGASPALVVVGGEENLGSVDGDRSVRGEIVVENHGDQPRALIVPGGISATPVRVLFPSSGVVVVPPGGEEILPFLYDARLDEGAAAFDVVLETTDPGAPLLYRHFVLSASHRFVAGPYRDLISRGNPVVRFFFMPKAGNAQFVSAEVEDETAPVSISVTPDVYSGRLDGVATVDESKASTAPHQGTVKIVGKTADGSSAYIWLQWNL